MYVVTKSGREVWESEDPAVPQQYRLLLWLLDVQGEKRAVRGLRQDHPERLLRDWLKELQELGFVESLPDNPNDTTIPLSLNKPSLTAGGDAASALNRTGAYISVDAARSGRRSKPPAQLTVLIVEDDPDQLSLADLRLSMAGYGVRTASSVGELMHAPLPIIMLTAERDPADIGKGLAWGADGYVTKPYSRDLLADVISRVLS